MTGLSPSLNLFPAIACVKCKSIVLKYSLINGYRSSEAFQVENLSGVLHPELRVHKYWVISRRHFKVEEAELGGLNIYRKTHRLAFTQVERTIHSERQLLEKLLIFIFSVELLLQHTFSVI